VILLKLGLVAQRRHFGRMNHVCEVCASFRPGAEFGPSYRVVMVQFDVRPVHLCVAHARIAESSGVKSFEALRELYGEDGEGRRSFVPRRAEPRGTGRRASDRVT
jgi:hypothetical protein